jgi:molybdate transport system substrate-binding protein
MRTKNVTRSLLALLAVGSITLVACGSDTASPATTLAPATTAPGTPAASGTIVVFAASSLTEAFKEIGTAFHTANPNATVTFNFAGSSDLVAQIGQGAPADVFASADDSNMKKLVDAGEATGTPKSVATNTFEIIVEKGNPKGIGTVADLAKPGVSVVLCAPAVPCGKGAAKVLANAKVVVTPKSLEEKVKGVVTKVTAGEADAGIVYVTDVKAAGSAAQGVEIPTELNAVSNYPMVVTKESKNPSAQAFIDFVAGPQGQAILASHGFMKP